ncbi:transposase [Saccharophagus degradans]|uniref:Transposase IS200-like domain-containing protein n=1 Tax=Saccharophagus degradans (strain 2-40 / ATCC 43961 / DSM 17024) TaxID=203122 RepID=Q21N58_SACD2|nr:transposase [Saccharophagus degradans]ABD79871.1 protein of unknown function DUF1568 [Saccharophagus degradans 2-40]
MPKPRKMQVSLDATPYYHCTSRCVRRAFLCGYDALTNTDYEHRRQWVEDRIHLLAEVFCIDVCAYAVMSNHIHLVLHINQPKALALTAKEVCARWHRVYKGTLLTQKYEQTENLTDVELDAVAIKIELWRKQLFDISWFMRALNEPIARMANAEDHCTGSFWESRFSSQALLDEKALAACMAYVDLNPVRANMADTSENSIHTSIKLRVDQIASNQNQPKTLYPFVGNPRQPMPDGLPFKLADYLELVDWTGRAVRPDKRGSICQHLPPILTRLGIAPAEWLILTTQFEKRVSTFAGSENAIRLAAENLGYKKPPGISLARSLFV